MNIGEMLQLPLRDLARLIHFAARNMIFVIGTLSAITVIVPRLLGELAGFGLVIFAIFFVEALWHLTDLPLPRKAAGFLFSLLALLPPLPNAVWVPAKVIGLGLCAVIFSNRRMDAR